MDGARRQGSLRVSSSVAEGVLTPAALHLRVSAEVERQNEGGGGAGWGGVGAAAAVVVNGPRCHRLHFSLVIEKPLQVPSQATFHSRQILSRCKPSLSEGAEP